MHREHAGSLVEWAELRLPRWRLGEGTKTCIAGLH